jgi:hypothetical protein
MFYLAFSGCPVTIPGVKEEMVGMIGIDNGFQHQPWHCFAEGFNRPIGGNFTPGDDAGVCRIRPAIRIGLCFIVQSSLLLARRLCATYTFWRPHNHLSQKTRMRLTCGLVFPRHWNRFANFRVNDKGPTGSVEPRQNNPPSILHQKQSRDVFGVNFLTLISWAAAT